MLFCRGSFVKRQTTTSHGEGGQDRKPPAESERRHRVEAVEGAIAGGGEQVAAAEEEEEEEERKYEPKLQNDITGQKFCAPAGSQLSAEVKKKDRLFAKDY